MESNFWLNKWQQNELGFHKSEANPLLVKYFRLLSLEPGNRVFLPLCGKTLDISWFLAQGYRVAGAELVEIAVIQLFAELGVSPTVTNLGAVKQYSAKNIDIFVGDIFQASAKMLGPVDAIYDRAALVALPEDVRDRYTDHLLTLTQAVPQLLITFEYDQTVMSGPPFSISATEVYRHYQDRYAISHLSRTNVPGGLKDKCAATENVWFLGRQ
ncbi:MAG: thiopurine S-methyltransferase [Cyanobacteria bacterium P01_F01_bin.150]